MAWDITKPLDTDDASGVGASAREIKAEIQSALQEEHAFPGSDVNNPVAYHKFPSGTTAERPAAGYANRWYHNSETGNIERDNGFAWETLVDKSLGIPAGTKCVFRMATAPTGWTQDATVNDRMIRALNGNGGQTGGTWTITTDSVSHNHGITTYSLELQWYAINVNHSGGTPNQYGRVMKPVGGAAGYKFSSVHDNTQGYSHAHTITSWRPSYVDCIICAKD